MKAAPATPWAKAPSSQRRDPTAGELASGFPCGPFDRELFNELMYRVFQAGREIHTVVAAAGLTPNDDDLTQLWQAVRKKFSIYWGIDAGTKNAIVCTLDPAPDAYTVPMLMVVRKMGTANDAAMTANFNGIGAVALKDMAGADLSSGALVGNGYQIIMFDGTQFRVLGGTSSYTTISGLTATGGEVIDVTVGGVVNANFEKPGYEAAFSSTDVLVKKKPGGVHKKFTWADLLAALPTTYTQYSSSQMNTAGAFTPTVPAWAKLARFRVTGGGAAGGNGQNGGSAGGGGGGEYREGFFIVAPGNPVAPGATLAVTVGAAGAVNPANGGNGGNGGTSSIGSIIAAVGGIGGLGTQTPFNYVAGGAGGSGGGGGSFARSGASGGQGQAYGNGIGGAAYGGTIAPSQFIFSGVGPGIAAQTPGCGGSGSGATYGAYPLGGAGAAGEVILEFWG